MTTLIAHKKFISYIIFIIILIAIFTLVTLSNTMKPIRVFSAYYSCRILSYSDTFNIDCNKLPTVSVTLPKLTNANHLGAEDPIELDMFFSNYDIEKHIYVHRTNSPSRAKIYRKYYSSFEFDAIWDAKKSAIDIYHWPERTSISFHFSDLLDIIGDKKYYWMDLKNLDNDNYMEIAAYIENLVSEGTTLDKNHLIIESKNPETLSILAKKRFYTSYYLPDAIFKGSCHDLESTTNIIIDNIKSYPTRYISFPYEQQEYIDRCLLPIIGEIEQLSWGGLPFAIPAGASTRYRAFIVDHSILAMENGN